MSTVIYGNLLYGGGIPVNNSRALNTNFQPNAARDCLVFYSVRITGGNAEGRVDLYMDATTTPTTLVLDTDSGANVSGLLATGNSQANQIISCKVKAGDYIKLTTVNVTGSPSFSISRQLEIPL